MKTSKEQLFSDMVAKWTKKTWAGWWNVNVIYRTGHEFLKANDFCSTGTIAICNTNWKYMTATIEVNSDALENEPDEDIEYFALHEIMHIFLNEMREEGIDHEERVATILARSFLVAGGEA
jgi:hypothetical protein